MALHSRLAALCALALIPAAPGLAQDYPVDTVTLVTHSSPGGGSDVFLREMAKFLGPALGATVVVENLSGGSGATAMANIAQSPADGSRLYATTPTFIYTSLLSTPEYTYKDLDPVVTVFTDPEVLFTSAKSPYMTLEDVVQKAREGRGHWGAANPASLERQAMEMLKTATGVNAAVVTHEGGGDMMINVLNGTLEMGVGEIQELKGQIEAGEIRLLASITEERIPGHPDLPTVREAGYDVAVQKFRGLAGPKGMPPEVFAAWEKAIPELLAMPEYKALYEPNSLQPDFMPHEEAAAFVASFGEETERFLKETGVIQ